LIRRQLAVNSVTRIAIPTGRADIAAAVDSIKLGATQYMAGTAHVEGIALAPVCPVCFW
jgi:ActR/RegA family two-component response regulator